MQAIIIGAGRGQRLMPTTADTPKCFAEVKGRRILDWIVEALQSNGISDICFIGGYQIDKVKAEYPQFTFRHNTEWEHNNILHSLMYAEDLMAEGFICSYSDILYTPRVIERLLGFSNGIGLAIDSCWLERYQDRTDHPATDAEKVAVQDGAVRRIHRELDPSETEGEYIGVARFGCEGARLLRESFQNCSQLYAGRPFRESPVFEKAYLIHLLQEMIENGIEMKPIDIAGEYMEIDTQQDFELARRHWLSKE